MQIINELIFNIFTNLLECTKFLSCLVLFFFRILLRLRKCLLSLKFTHDKHEHQTKLSDECESIYDQKL